MARSVVFQSRVDISDLLCTLAARKDDLVHDLQYVRLIAHGVHHLLREGHQAVSEKLQVLKLVLKQGVSNGIISVAATHYFANVVNSNGLVPRKSQNMCK